MLPGPGRSVIATHTSLAAPLLGVGIASQDREPVLPQSTALAQNGVYAASVPTLPTLTSPLAGRRHLSAINALQAIPHVTSPHVLVPHLLATSAALLWAREDQVATGSGEGDRLVHVHLPLL